MHWFAALARFPGLRKPLAPAFHKGPLHTAFEVQSLVCKQAFKQKMSLSKREVCLSPLRITLFVVTLDVNCRLIVQKLLSCAGSTAERLSWRGIFAMVTPTDSKEEGTSSWQCISFEEKVQLNESDSTDSDGELLRSTTRHQHLEAIRLVVIRSVFEATAEVSC